MGNFVKFSAAIMLLSSLALVGCGGSKEKQVVGHYKTMLTIPAGKENDPGLKALQGITANMSLDLKEDKTFTMGAGAANQEGTWSYADNKVTFSPKNPKPEDKAMTATVGADGTLRPDDNKGGPDFYFQKDPK